MSAADDVIEKLIECLSEGRRASLADVKRDVTGLTNRELFIVRDWLVGYSEKHGLVGGAATMIATVDNQIGRLVKGDKWVRG